MARVNRVSFLACIIVAMAITLVLSACDGVERTYLPPIVPATITLKPTKTLTPTPTPTPTEIGSGDVYYQPVWRCATPRPAPTSCDLTGACTTAQPTATTYLLTDNFPPPAHVQVGPIARPELGVWIWIEDVQIFNTTTRFPDEWNGQLWIVMWKVHVKNASADPEKVYQFVPLLGSQISKVRLPDGTAFSGNWLPSSDAAKELRNRRFFLFPIQDDFPYLDVPEGSGSDEAELTYVYPGKEKVALLAGYIPGYQVLEMTWQYQPPTIIATSDATATEIVGDSGAMTYRMEFNNDDLRCYTQPISEVTAGPGGFDAIPKGGAAAEGLALRWPIEGGNLTRSFGCVTDFTGVRGSVCPSRAPWFHNGIDVGVPVGTAYTSPFAVESVIEYAGPDLDGRDCSSIVGAQNPTSGLGNFIKQTAVIEGHTVTVIGGHLSQIDVDGSRTIQPGEKLGETGSTGCSTGPRLHFTVILDGVVVDPLELLP